MHAISILLTLSCSKGTPDSGTISGGSTGAATTGGTSGTTGGTTGTTGGTTSTGSTDTLPEICNSGSSWSAGITAFSDASESWGLPGIDAAGVVINGVDFDGDGWTDLAVRGHGGVDDFSEGGERNTWLLRNTGAGTFTDVTQSSGVITPRLGGDGGRPGQVWALGDVDNDGDVDVFTGLPDRDGAIDETSEIMLNDGAGGFALGPEASDVRDHADDPGGAAFIDFDRDGNLDLWVTQYYATQDWLLLGDGTGAFTDATRGAGLTTMEWSLVSTLNNGEAHSVAWGALACDLNRDGDPELLASSYGRAPNHLWQATGGGEYENQSVASGYAYDDRTDWSDNESARCWCTLHPDDADCDGVPEPEYISCSEDDDAFRWDHTYDREAFRLGGNSGATTCADVDNDGWMDLLTSEIVHWDVGESADPSELLFNQGATDVAFDRPGNDVTGILREHDADYGWDDGDITGSIFDFDNDGWADVYIGSTDYAGTRGWLYHQSSARSFEAVALEDGIDHTRSHGSVIADFDRDGDLDIVVGHSSMRCEDDCYDTFGVRLFENQMGATSNFIQLSLEGTDANRSAIGARVTVTADGVTQTQEVDGGHGHYGNQNDLVLHFGLGAACSADVTVRWPDAALSEQSFTVGGGYRYHVTQGEDPEVEL